MDSITLASPFTVNGNGNQSVLSSLLGYVPKTAPILASWIPVSNKVDISTIVQQNNLSILDGTQAGRGSSKQETDIVDDEVMATQEEDVEPASFVPLERLNPQNRLEQITTVLIQGFPSLKRPVIDRIFRQLVHSGPESIPKNFTWSFVVEGATGIHGDRKNVFLRLGGLVAVEWLHKNSAIFADALPDLLIVFDQEVDGSDAEETKSKDEFTSYVTKVLLNRANFSRGLGRTGTEDLDQVMQYYRTYKVEDSELVEVPKDMKETIVKDIINFRSKMLQLERERRKKEIEQERRKAKARLTKMFMGIREAVGVTETANDSEVEDVEEKGDPLDSLLEEEYAKHIAEQETKKAAADYKAKLEEMERMEKNEKQSLLNQLVLLQNYESNLIDNKDTYMEDIKNFDDMNVPRANASLSSKLQLYYSNHLEYVRLRNLERSREEELDKADEKEELQSTPSVHSFSLPAKKTLPVEKSEPVGLDIVVSSLSEVKLESIKSKICDLVEEYLGIKENLLIDFIFEFVKDHGLGKRQELIDELVETLDDDSTTVVDLLYKHIISLA